ncbi:hypothetical protein I5V28_09185 [Stenotrophomonas maltophilia]|nr:hypothetical protein [Stenotrophomonas maltophilia]
MDVLLKVLRWVLGLFLGFTALGALFAGSFIAFLLMAVGVLVIIPPSGAWIGRFIAPVSRHGAAIGIGLVCFFAGLAMAVITSEPTKPAAVATATTGKPATPPVAPAAPTPAPAPAAPAAPAQVDVSRKISPDAVFLIEGEGWDKTRREWGSAGIERINAAMPKAAEKVAQSSSCDYVELVGLSDRGKPKQQAVFYVDCKNGQRFYVSEDDLKSDAGVVSKNAKTAAISDSTAIKACEDSVKSQLNFPLTFDRDLLNTSVYRAPTGNIAVQFTFQAKNALGAELPQRARCVIDDTGIEPAQISNN